MNEPDASPAAERIARALARLRGPRPSPFDRGSRTERGSHTDHGAHADRGPHGHHGHGPHGGFGPHGGPGPFRMGDHGPMGRFAAKFRLLEALSDAPSPLSVSEIAEKVGVDQPRASRLVQACVDDGLVRREASPDDARRTNVVLADPGRALVARARGARVGAIDQALATFSAEEREQLATLLAKLADAWPR